jgi:hypothetical protein
LKCCAKGLCKNKSAFGRAAPTKRDEEGE